MAKRREKEGALKEEDILGGGLGKGAEGNLSPLRRERERAPLQNPSGAAEGKKRG